MSQGAKSQDQGLCLHELDPDVCDCDWSDEGLAEPTSPTILKEDCQPGEEIDPAYEDWVEENLSTIRKDATFIKTIPRDTLEKLV
jgi:hypothetical protein